MNLGKVSESVLKHSILYQIHTRNEEVVNGAGIGADCAIFASSGEGTPAVCVKEAAVATCRELGRMNEEPPVPGVVCVSMAQLITRCANNLAVSGAVPAAVMIALLLPQNAGTDLVKELMQEAENACKGLSIQIAGGQTRVSSAVSVPYAVVTGYGKAQGMRYCTVKGARPGQDIVLSKWVGLEGTAVLARRYRERLLARYPSYLAREAAEYDRYLSVLPEAALAMKSNVCAMHDASEGGIFAGLWELAEGAGVGLTIDMKKIPLRQETVEVCECCGANPYELLSGGCLIMTAEDGDSLAEALEAEHIPAAVIGRITDSNDRVIRNEDEIRYMDRPKTDEVYKNFE